MCFDSSPSSALEGVKGAFQMSGRVIFAVSLVVLLSGCTAILGVAKPVFDLAKLAGHGKPASTTQVRLDAQKSVFITVPGDGEFADALYLGSGRAVAQAIAMAFTRRGIPVLVAKGHLTREQALSTAARLDAGYLVLPVITLWNQRNEWLSRPSRLAVRISILDVATGRLIESKPVETRNLTVLAFTISDPESLLEEPIYKYVSALYQSPPPLASLHTGSLPAYGLKSPPPLSRSSDQGEMCSNDPHRSPQRP